MDSNVLRDQLAKLHAELGTMKQADPGSDQLLRDVLQDIQRLLEPPRADDAGPAPSPTSLPDRLEKVAVQFEADHPVLAASSRRLIDLLGKAGV
jgi:hypothetical protein